MVTCSCRGTEGCVVSEMQVELRHPLYVCPHPWVTPKNQRSNGESFCKWLVLRPPANYSCSLAWLKCASYLWFGIFCRHSTMRRHICQENCFLDMSLLRTELDQIAWRVLENLWWSMCRAFHFPLRLPSFWSTLALQRTETLVELGPLQSLRAAALGWSLPQMHYHPCWEPRKHKTETCYWFKLYSSTPIAALFLLNAKILRGTGRPPTV